MARRKSIGPKRMITREDLWNMGIRDGAIPGDVYHDLQNHELAEPPSFDVNLATRLAHKMVEEKYRNR